MPGKGNNPNPKNDKDEKKQEVVEQPLNLKDSIYFYDEAKIDQQQKERPWKKDSNYFKRVRINVLSATKMVRHAVQGVVQGKQKGGLPIEVMGLLVGKPDGDTLIIMDCVELPVEGSETRVVADDEKVLGFMTRMQERIESLRKDRFIGWYHSHPFEVGVHSNCFLSGIDVNTQLMWQMQFGKWVGIVVDPLRCLAKQRVELGCFMAHLPEYDPPKNQGPDGVLENNKEILTNRWGQVFNRYYQLKHSFFMGSLVRFNLEMMSRKHLWIRQLSSSTILETENRNELPKRIQTMNKKFSNAPRSSGNNQNKRGGDDYDEASNMSRDIAMEQCLGQASQLIKNTVFNAQLASIQDNNNNNNNSNNNNNNDQDIEMQNKNDGKQEK